MDVSETTAQAGNGNRASSGGELRPLVRLARSRRGEPVDRTPISFWQHFPTEDGDPQRLTEATLAFQERYRLDLVKLMPSGMYSVVDYGAVTGPPDPTTGARGLRSGPIRSMDDFGELAPATPDRSSLAAQLSVAAAVRGELPAEVPVIDTLFSPLTMASKLAGRSPRELIEAGSSAALHRGLERMVADCIGFASEDLSTGVDGFFFAIQWANAGVLSADQQEEFGVRYDLQVLNELRGRSDILMLHLHGPMPNFALASRYPVDWVNWEDTETAPSLTDARGATQAGLAAGITRNPALLTGSHDEAVAILRDAISVTGGTRLLLAPGCVLPQQTSAEVLLAIRAAVEGNQPSEGSPEGEGRS